MGVRYFQGNRSPNDAERLDRGYSSAWLHHKGRNKHHLEYWIDYSLQPPEENPLPLTGMEMPVKYVVEMFCDRMAASKTYRKELYQDGDPWEYYAKSKSKYLLHPASRELLESLLLMLRDRGGGDFPPYPRSGVEKIRRRGGRSAPKDNSFPMTFVWGGCFIFLNKNKSSKIY